VQEEAAAAAAVEALAPPARAAESAPVDGADRADPPPRERQEEVEEGGAAKPGATAGSSLQDAPLIEEAVQGGGGGHGDGGAQEQSPGTCDLYKGRWVYDESRAPLYKESDCSFLTEQVTCTRNGRRDDDYQKWRWQPDGCDLPRYHHGLASLLACHCISSVYPFTLSTDTVRIRVRPYGLTRPGARSRVGACALSLADCITGKRVEDACSAWAAAGGQITLRFLFCLGPASVEWICVCIWGVVHQSFLLRSLLTW